MDYLNEINDLQAQINELKAEIKNINELIKSLRHYRDTTVGLWATDKPEKVQDPEVVMFKLEDEMKKELTSNDIKELTGITQIQLDNLIRVDKLNDYVIRRGSGRKRIFKPEAVDFIKAWMNVKS